MSTAIIKVTREESDIDWMMYYEEKQIEAINKKKSIIEVIVSDEDMFKQLKNIIQWLDSLKNVFGEYSIGGYINNKVVNDKYHFRLYPKGNYYISMHVVYYQTMLKAVELVEIMKHSSKQGFIYERIHKLVDPNIYELVEGNDGRGGMQKFRHVLPD